MTKLKMITPISYHKTSAITGEKLSCNSKDLSALFKGFQTWAMGKGYVVECRGEYDTMGGFGVSLHDESCCDHFLKYLKDQDLVVGSWLTSVATEDEFDLFKRWWTCVMMDQFDMASRADDLEYRTMRNERGLEIANIMPILAGIALARGLDKM